MPSDDTGSNEFQTYRPARGPNGVTPQMLPSLLIAAERMAAQLLEEASAALYAPVRQPPMEENRWMKIYQRQDESVHSKNRRRMRSADVASTPSTPSTGTSTPRLYGVATLHASLDDVVDILVHDLAASFPWRHPGAVQGPFSHTLLDLVNEHAMLRSFTMDAASVLEVKREFQVVEYHHVFETRHGRRGVVVLFHSVEWPGCPLVGEDTVRGGLYRSGIVALESDQQDDTLELFCATEINLKGLSSLQQSMDASRQRILATLARIMTAVEQRAKSRLSLGQTSVFKTATQHNQTEHCRTCHDRIALLPPNTEPYLCRKCLVCVCSDCSNLWQLGRKEMRLCMECWADATLNRT